MIPAVLTSAGVGAALALTTSVYFGVAVAVVGFALGMATANLREPRR